MPKNNCITVYLSASEKEKINFILNYLDMTASQFVREIINNLNIDTTENKVWLDKVFTQDLNTNKVSINN